MNKTFEIDLEVIQPSQLYISKQKLIKVKENFNPTALSNLKAIPIKNLNDEIFFTDGHTRAFAAFQAGLTKIPVIWENEELDWEIYKICIKWCKDEGIYCIADLKDRVIEQKEYEILWYKRCADLQNKLEKSRKKF